MNVEITGSIERKVINKFSKFIMEFKDTNEFKDYIKQNKFKIMNNVPDEDNKILKYNRINPMDWDKTEQDIQKNGFFQRGQKSTQYTYIKVDI